MVIKCQGCKRDINRGVESQKQVQVWRNSNGVEKSFGLGAPDGNLVPNSVTGAYEIPPEGRAWARETGAKILAVYHSKHWHHRMKREMRGGDTVSGRNLGAATTTAYDISTLAMNREQMEEAGLTEDDIANTTRRMQDRADAIRKMAREAGTATGDWGIKERVRLMDHGGNPYPHTHSIRLKDFQLPTHLLYAHGIHLKSLTLTDDAVVIEEFEADPLGDVSAARLFHEVRHSEMARAKVESYKAADPGDGPHGEADWRYQEVLEVSDVPVPEEW